MFSDEKKKKEDACYNCGGKLEVIEADLKKGTKIMKCQACGLFHFYSKGLVGNWQLRKVTKDPAHSLEIDW